LSSFSNFLLFLLRHLHFFPRKGTALGIQFLATVIYSININTPLMFIQLFGDVHSRSISKMLLLRILALETLARGEALTSYTLDVADDYSGAGFFDMWNFITVRLCRRYDPSELTAYKV
jgi:hypothetical protein